MYRIAIKDGIAIFKENGLHNFWRGNMANILRVFPNAAIVYLTYEYILDIFYL